MTFEEWKAGIMKMVHDMADDAQIEEALSIVASPSADFFVTLRMANALRQAEWDPDDKIDLSYRAMELGGEVGEALNVIKKIVRERAGIRGSRASPFALAHELADVIICVDLIAMGEGIDLREAVTEKFNATSQNNHLRTRIPPYETE